MKLADVSIRHPVFLTMCVLALLVLGMIGYMRLPVEFFPDITLPIVAVTIPYPGASPEDVEGQVTKPVEEALSVMRGVKKVRSTSTEGVSIVVVEFELEFNSKDATNEVRDKVTNIRRQLPRDILEPVYEKFDPSDQPIITYSVLSKTGELNSNEIRYLIEKKIKPSLERIEGVAAISLLGGEEREIEIAVSRSRLESYGVSMDHVISALRLSNVETPAGRFTTRDQELLLKTDATFTSVHDLESVVISTSGNAIVRLADVAQVRDGYKDARQLSFVDGSPSVTMDIRKQAGTNTVQIAKKVRSEIERITSTMPQVKAVLAIDESIFIKNSRDDVVAALLEGIVLASLVVLLFFRDLRGTIITVAGLPLCIIGTFFFLNMFGYTINLITLLALSLSIGLLIDDAIVVRENIFRYLEQGKSPFKAAREATSEVALAVLATSLTVIAVFLPIAFTQGIAGKFFRQFGVTISVAVLISLIEAFTVAPMLSAYFFKARKAQAADSLLERFFRRTETEYHALLEWALSHRVIVIVATTVIMLASIGVVPLVGVAGDGRADRGQYSVVCEAPQSVSLTEMARRVKAVEKILAERPHTTSIFTTIGSSDGSANQASILVGLDRLNVTKAETRAIRPSLKAIPGLRVSLEEVTGIRNRSATIAQRPIQINVQGPDLKVLKQIADDMQQRIKPIAGIADLDNSLRGGKPEYRYRVKRDAMARYGTNPTVVAHSVRTLIQGETATTFRDGEDEIDVNVRFDAASRVSPEQLLSYRVDLPEKRSTQLFEVVELTDATGPSQINRQDRTRQVVIAANIERRPLGEIFKDVKIALADLPLPPGYTLKYEGQVSQNKESFSNLFLALFLAIMFVYMVLASQFNSFLHPFTIMLALPLTVIGGFFGLLIAGTAFDMLAFIGLIMLMGLVTKNSILLVDFTNRLRSQGYSIRDALLTAGPIRLRPILMTSLAMIFGMIPTATGFGAAASFRVPLGVMVIGGLISSTLLTLVIVPVAYDIFENLKRKLGFRESFATGRDLVE